MTGLRQTRPEPRPADVEAGRREQSGTAAIDRAMTALGDRLRDPEVQDGARRAAAGLSTAVGATVDETRPPRPSRRVRRVNHLPVAD